MAPPVPMVHVPGSLAGSLRLATRHASTILTFPKGFDPTATCQGSFQLPVQPCFQVRFPLRTVRSGGAAYLHKTPDGHAARCHQGNGNLLPLFTRKRAGEDPVAMSGRAEVGRLDPRPGLVLVSSPTPALEHSEDTAVHLVEGALARRMTVVHGPALDL